MKNNWSIKVAAPPAPRRETIADRFCDAILPSRVTLRLELVGAERGAEVIPITS
jgi:hypothetical protein